MRHAPVLVRRGIAAASLVGIVLAPAAATASTAAADGSVREETVRGPLAANLARLGGSARGPLWFAWEVPAVPTLGDSCCFEGLPGRDRRVCHLAGDETGWGSSRSDLVPPSGGNLRVLARWSGGAVDRVLGVSESCAIDPGGLPLVHLGGVSAGDSVSLLADLAARGETRHDGDGALAALAYHDDPAADGALLRLAAAGRPERRREQALFWIGRARGEAGVRFLAGVSRHDPSPDIREKAVFALSQNGAAAAAAAIVEVARHDDSPHVRGQALFWLAQSGAPDAATFLLARLGDDPSSQVREQAVFALSQLHDGEGVPLLMRVAREHHPTEVRRQALFWLGQSDDPRALDFFEQILGQKR